MSNKPLKKGDQKTPWGKREMTHKRERKMLSLRTLFRIYCEGAVTEPEYFRAFPINPATTRIFAKGYGRSKTSLVEYVIEELRKKQFLPGQKKHDKNRQNWVVFDYDWKGEDGECEDFKNAIALAKAHSIRTAISNDAFEVWFLLHFQYFDAGIHRDDIYKKLTELLGEDYEKIGKGKGKARQLYKRLLHLQATAIQNAETLCTAKSSLDPCEQCSFTNVHLLVTELNKNLRR